MARRSFDVVDLIDLFTHWHAGMSQRQISENLQIDRKTVAKYLAPAIEESLAPGGASLTEEQWSANIARWFPEVADPQLRATTWPLIDPHRDQIMEWLAADVSVATITRRLRDDYWMMPSESTVRRWIKANAPADDTVDTDDTDEAPAAMSTPMSTGPAVPMSWWSRNLERIDAG